jgi:hypothetical protein
LFNNYFNFIVPMFGTENRSNRSIALVIDRFDVSCIA